jgi:hypothetical protein
MAYLILYLNDKYPKMQQDEEIKKKRCLRRQNKSQFPMKAFVETIKILLEKILERRIFCTAVVLKCYPI